MATITLDIPDETLAEIKSKAEEAAAEIMHNELVEIACKFIDVTDLSTSGRKLRHVLTGRTLLVTAEWQDANG